MKRYPHTTPWSAALGFAAAVATVATLGLAIVLPASVDTRIVDDAAFAAKASAVSVTIETVEVAARPANILPAPAKQRG
jgi:hypothetical protein